MITFLPFPSFRDSAIALDNGRLGKQRVEVKQLLEGFLVGNRTRHHPASHMWEGFVPALIDYGIAICKEWRNRGFQDSVFDYLQRHRTNDVVLMPPWFNIPEFHSSHRSRLVFKNPNHYRTSLGWIDNPLEPYLWPVQASETTVTFRYGSTAGLVTLTRPIPGIPWRAQSNPKSSEKDS